MRKRRGRKSVGGVGGGGKAEGVCLQPRCETNQNPSTHRQRKLLARLEFVQQKQQSHGVQAAWWLTQREVEREVERGVGVDKKIVVQERTHSERVKGKQVGRVKRGMWV